ncbi:hypothetical protein K493DRAFT_412399 [Basidiobolus meristosporus CBS 931.73]|uniref:Xylanolytic transcriptional activator regulatory domain-containing protein n=1 Tax=Basidiobolus meristosporus CBS 931.73 TaxID=1314790 RepID=A0A1Y1WX00_9FUNG|nr:hypothetical protein K493DRAFT_412399 [Basidiobolus meristosporus CBS 931.73]|eukprot:ORX78079.1 hypothetical protein K493DRAFT_412399 [Basidiobolus meristosporus CBS 931.73]
MDSQDALDTSKPMKRKRLTQACDVCRKKKRGPRQGPSATEEKLPEDCVEFFRRFSAPGATPPSRVEQRGPPVRSSSLSAAETSNMISIPVLSSAPHNYFSNFSHIPIPSFDAGGTPFFGNIGSQALPTYSQQYQALSPVETFEKEAVEDETAVREKVEQVWSQSYLGNTSGLHSLSTGGSKEKTPSPKSESEVLCLVGADSLPPPQITEHLANIYFDVIYPQMPFVHRPTFFRKLKNKEVPPILILSICACVSRLSNHPAILADECTRRGEIFSDRFRDILVLCLDDPCISTTQALLIFSYYEYTNARISRSWMYLGMAVRMAQELGINRLDEGGSVEGQCPSEWVEAETRRRVWWSCFIRDRLVSSGTGRSMAIDEQDTRVLLPCDEKDFNNENPVETELLDISDNATSAFTTTFSPQASKKEICTGYRAHWVKLVALLGRVSQFVNSPKFRKTPPSAETSARFTVLESSLTAWAESLPSQYKYPCQLVSEPSPSGYSRAGFIICIHILYHTIIILLYRSNLDMSASGSILEDSWKRCIVSANEIAAAIPAFYTYPSCYNYPHISFGIFTAGTVFMHSLFSTQVATAVEEARSKLERTYHTLLMLKKEWPMAGKYGTLLKGLVSIRSRVVSPGNPVLSEQPPNTGYIESTLLPTAFQSPVSELAVDGVDLTTPEIQFDRTSNGAELYPSPDAPQVDHGAIEFFNGFQDLVDIPFGQGSFFDGLLNNIYMSSCTDPSTDGSLLPVDAGNVNSELIHAKQALPSDTRGLLQEWPSGLANSF